MRKHTFLYVCIWIWGGDGMRVSLNLPTSCQRAMSLKNPNSLIPHTDSEGVNLDYAWLFWCAIHNQCPVDVWSILAKRVRRVDVEQEHLSFVSISVSPLCRPSNTHVPCVGWIVGGWFGRQMREGEMYSISPIDRGAASIYLLEILLSLISTTKNNSHSHEHDRKYRHPAEYYIGETEEKLSSVSK